MNDDIKKYIEVLDPEIKKFVLNDKWRSTIQKICSDYGIKDPEMIRGVEIQTFFVIIGLEYINDFGGNLKSLGLPDIQAEPLSEAIAKDILFDIAEYLPAKEPEKELPDASLGLISNKEEIIKNPLNSTNNELEIRNRELKKENNELGIMNKEKPEIQKPIAQQSVPPKAQGPQPTPLKASNIQPTANLSWEERKKRAEEALKNVVPVEPKKYPGGADPYREPTQ